jgi:Flp pilus assembly protein TadD
MDESMREATVIVAQIGQAGNEFRTGRLTADRGLTLIREGRWDEALEQFRRAVALEPGSVEFLRYLAEAAAVREVYPEVKACCLRILDIDPGQAVVHNALGWVLQLEGQPEEAIAHYRAAIRLQPDFATAHYNLATFHEELGEPEEAEASYRTTLGLDPANATALARLATLLRDRLPEIDLAVVFRRLSEQRLDSADRANLLFALAQIHDARHQFVAAADCLEQANALALDQLDSRGQAYDPAEHDRFVDAVIAAFRPAFFDRLAGAGLDTPRPVFVFGLPRSGTTLIEQVLASHPAVHGAGEVPLVRQSWDEIPPLLRRSDPSFDCLADLGVADVRELARRHEERLRKLDGGRSQRVVIKMPENYFYLGLIAILFPRAVFVHCRRDLRDVALSCWSTNFRDVRWASHVEHIAGRFASYQRLMGHWRRVLPVAIHPVDYEQTVADLEGVARRLVDACGLSWEPACLNFHRTRRPIRTASASQVRQPVYQHAVGRWKSYERELAGLFARIDTSGDPH